MTQLATYEAFHDMEAIIFLQDPRAATGFLICVAQESLFPSFARPGVECRLRKEYRLGPVPYSSPNLLFHTYDIWFIHPDSEEIVCNSS